AARGWKWPLEERGLGWLTGLGCMSVPVELALGLAATVREWLLEGRELAWLTVAIGQFLSARVKVFRLLQARQA
ncbi:MAG TPA: hypothetical protein G4N96_05200, partial [Chloroflexi bacterium]|nr:hypothetical protein [Chloroflexota bacterium]